MYFDDNGDGDEEKEGGKINIDVIFIVEFEEMVFKLIM